jgi:hypothetical protein
VTKVYFPLRYIDVPASPPHDGDPAYRVSVGIEHWTDGSAQRVYKIQMVYGAAVHGRKSPSYPADSPDLDLVLDALAKVRAGKGHSGRGKMTSVGDEPGLSSAEVKEALTLEP